MIATTMLRWTMVGVVGGLGFGGCVGGGYEVAGWRLGGTSWGKGWGWGCSISRFRVNGRGLVQESCGSLERCDGVLIPGQRCNARAFGFCSCLESVKCRCTAGMRVWNIYRCNVRVLEVEVAMLRDASRSKQIVASYQLTKLVIVDVALLYIRGNFIEESMRRKEETAHRVL